MRTLIASLVLVFAFSTASVGAQQETAADPQRNLTRKDKDADIHKRKLKPLHHSKKKREKRQLRLSPAPLSN